MTHFERVTSYLHRATKVWWVVLVLSIFGAVWTSSETPMLSSGGQGVGMVLFDYMAVISLWVSVIFQGGAISVLRRTLHQHPVTLAFYYGQFLMLFGLSVIAARLTWVIYTIGDPRMTVSMVIALLCISTSTTIQATAFIILDGDLLPKKA